MDQCVLEDESGRIELVAADPSLIRRLCTGVVVAVLGVQDDSGRFHISRLLLPDMPPQKPLSSGNSSSHSHKHSPSPPPRYVLLVSGLSFGCPSVDPLPLTLLADWCCGLGGQRSDAQRAASIAAVVVMGNSLHRFSKKKSKDGLKEVSTHSHTHSGSTQTQQPSPPRPPPHSRAAQHTQLSSSRCSIFGRSMQMLLCVCVCGW